jgi:SAM-dependent methyltransferase
LAQAAGCDVTACDVVPELAARFAREGIGFYVPAELPLDAFDFINAEQVFEHLTEPAATLRKLIRSLKPHGVIKIGVPFDRALDAKLLAPDWRAMKSSPASLNAVAPIEHLNAFNPEALGKLGALAGLRRLSIKGWTLYAEREGRVLDLWTVPTKEFLRRKMNESYRPAYALAQTVFFVRS